MAGCCGSSKGYLVKSVPKSNLLIADPKSWLPIPTTTAPPGGWGVAGFRAATPQEAADKLAGLRISEGRFSGLKGIYEELVKTYCSRPGCLGCPPKNKAKATSGTVELSQRGRKQFSKSGELYQHSRS